MLKLHQACKLQPCQRETLTADADETEVDGSSRWCLQAPMMMMNLPTMLHLIICGERTSIEKTTVENISILPIYQYYLFGLTDTPQTERFDDPCTEQAYRVFAVNYYEISNIFWSKEQYIKFSIGIINCSFNSATIKQKHLRYFEWEKLFNISYNSIANVDMSLLNLSHI